MCCFFIAIFFFGPRLGFLVYWLLPSGQVKISKTFNGFMIVSCGLA